MKKIIFICIVAMGILSCSTDQTNDVNLNEANTLKIETVLKSKGDEDAQKVAYRLLNENEKFLLWKNRFDLLLEEKALNANQKELILEFRDKITVSVFSDTRNDEQEYFKNIFVLKYLEKIKKKFTFEEIRTIFYTLETLDNLKDNSNPDPLNPLYKDCNCNKGSLYSCNAGLGCENKRCEGSSVGCGVMWLWECNGLCSLT